MAHSYPSADETQDGFKKLSDRYAITIIEQKEEISRLKRENNNLRQKLHRGKPEEPIEPRITQAHWDSLNDAQATLKQVQERRKEIEQRLGIKPEEPRGDA
jgi:hypothetical protein